MILQVADAAALQTTQSDLNLFPHLCFMTALKGVSSHPTKEISSAFMHTIFFFFDYLACKYNNSFAHSEFNTSHKYV